MSETVLARKTMPVSGFAPSRWIGADDDALLRNHANLPGAVAAFAAFLVELYQDNALLCDRGRIVLGFFLLYLDAFPMPGTTRTGATLSTVQALCRRSGVCSAGRAASILAAMRFGGYIAVQADPQDSRRRTLVPTARLRAVHHQHWASQFRAMTSVFPKAALVPVRFDTPSIRSALLFELGEYFLAGFRVIDHTPVLARLAESSAGLLILSSLVLRHLRGETAFGDPMPNSVSRLARHFCVSRAHVRNTLSVSEDAGLLLHARGSGSVVVLAALAEAIIQFYGILFLLFDRCVSRALRVAAA